MEPSYWGMEKLTCNLEFALVILEEEMLEEVHTNEVKMEVKTNCAQSKTLANVYRADLERIITLVQMVLQLYEAPSTFPQFNGRVDSLSLLLLSLVKIGHCMHSGDVTY